MIWVVVVVVAVFLAALALAIEIDDDRDCMRAAERRRLSRLEAELDREDRRARHNDQTGDLPAVLNRRRT